MRQQLLYSSVSLHNILPLTSRCGVNCLFCSHRYNPPGVRAVFFGELGLNTIIDLIELLDPGKKIVIGESATQLCEGEPLMHPDFQQALQLLRGRFRNTPIQVTTNGIGLSASTVHELSQSGPLELIISLNSADPQSRRRLMGSHDVKRTLSNIAGLVEAGVPWHASLVLMPWVTGWSDIDNTLSFAAGNGARTARLLLPGFSRLAGLDWQALAAVPGEARARLGSWRRKYPHMPITLEPALPQDLRAEVSGILAMSPASGLLLPGDEVVLINNKKPFSRVDAFFTLYRLANPRLVVRRGDAEVSLTLPKPARSSSGVVMDRDLGRDDLERALAMAGGADRVLLLTSLWALPLWRQVVPKGWQTLGVESLFFGGNIGAAGLLTVRDYQATLDGLTEGYERILLPPVSFDHSGLDLLGISCRDLANQLSLPLVWD